MRADVIDTEPQDQQDTPKAKTPGARTAWAGQAGIVPRIATALVLVPLALAAIWLGGGLYAAVIAAMTIFLLFEWTRLVAGAEFGRGFYALSLTAIVVIAFAAAGRFDLALWSTLGGGVLATVLEWPRRSPDSWAGVGAAYIIVPAVATLWIRHLPGDGRTLTILLFAVVWATDSAAYLTGRAVGGPKLVPRVSPSKTWSGAVGGVMAGGAAAGLVAAFGTLNAPGVWALAGFLVSIASIFGDIAESHLKRTYGVKDSGSAFPGHGGVLDRLDGFLFAALALSILVLVRQHG
jgi:phosphatidate cytidylyltransferase